MSALFPFATACCDFEEGIWCCTWQRNLTKRRGEKVCGEIRATIRESEKEPVSGWSPGSRSPSAHRSGAQIWLLRFVYEHWGCVSLNEITLMSSGACPCIGEGSNRIDEKIRGL